MSNNNEINQNKKPKGRFNWKSPWAFITYATLSLLLFVGGLYGYLYVSTPGNIRHPSFDHYHFRTQIVVNGKPVDFSRQKFQEDISKNSTSCSIELNGTPIDFHDNEDQMTHIHWGGITGGQFLKYYGWDLIGGSDGSLGRRYDQGMMRMHAVNIKGNVLPEIPKDTNFYVYTGDEDSYEQKSWDDFLSKDLEAFFGRQSRVGGNESSFNIFDLFNQKAYAHGAVDDGHEESVADQATLERVSNLIGNVVIFVQKSEPSSEQVQARFSDLVPLHGSSCGG